MTQEFNEEPFQKIRDVLNGLEQVEPATTDLGVDKVDDPEKRQRQINEALTYVEQARKFLKGAEAHDSGEAYKLADDSIDDLQQRMQILTPAYPDQISQIRPEINEVWSEKRRVYSEISVDPATIEERDYNQVLMDTRDYGMVESGKNSEDVLIVVDNPFHRPRYRGED